MKKLLTIAAVLLSLAASAQTATRTQCAAQTQAKVQCKRPAKTGSTFCFQHDDKAPRCGKPTAAGTPCKHLVKNAGEACKMHR